MPVHYRNNTVNYKPFLAEFKMAAGKPEVEITFEQLEKATRFKLLPEVQKEMLETNHVHHELKEKGFVRPMTRGLA